MNGIPPVVRSSGDQEWRRGRRRKTKGERSMKKKNDRRMKKDERRVKNACFSTRVVGTFVPSSRELKLTHRHSALRVQLSYSS
jgi:hypothetical protein